jgi:hypothetical protein
MRFDLSKKGHWSRMGFGKPFVDDIQMGDYPTEWIVSQHEE